MKSTAAPFNPVSFVQPHILDMPAYEPILPFEVLSEKLGLPASALVKLDANENPYGPIPEVGEALATLPYAHIYPDPQSQALRKKLAERLAVPFENILAGAGADELIDLVMRVCVGAGDVVLNCPPTFGMYQFDADLQNARVINVPRLPDFSLDLPGILAAVQAHQPRLLFLASPNNPDGGQIPPETLEQILALPVLVVLDEAYIEFATPGSSYIQEAARRNNLVVLRTFSKWAGLAGLRVGYGVFPSALMPHLWKVKQPYNVSVAASTAAIVSLENAGSLERVGKLLVDERTRLAGLLAQFPWLKPYPSQSNFILCQVVGRDAAEIKQRLAEKGILIRYFNKPGLRDHIRISVGKPKHTDALVEALKSL